MGTRSQRYNTVSFSPNSIEFAALLAVVFVAMQFLNLMFIPEQRSRVMISNIMQTISAIFCMVFIIQATVKTKKSNEGGYSAFLMISFASFLWTIGAASFLTVEVVFSKLPYPSFSDYFYIVFYPLMIAGFLLLPYEKTKKGNGVNLFLEVVIVVISASLILWNLSLSYSFAALSKETIYEKFFSLIYSLLDGILLLVMITVPLRRLKTEIPILPVIIMIAACVFLIFSDLLQAYISTYTNFVSGTIADIGWCMFTATLGIAGAVQLKDISDVTSRETALTYTWRPKSKFNLIFTYFWLLSLVALFLIGLAGKANINMAFLTTETIGCVVLMIYRQIREIME